MLHARALVITTRCESGELTRDLARLTADGQVVIMFSDIEGSTGLNDALGDREWVKLLEQHNKLFYKHVDEHGGHVVKS